MGLLCNNRPVTLRKCGKAPCVSVFLCVCVFGAVLLLLLFIFSPVHVNLCACER